MTPKNLKNCSISFKLGSFGCKQISDNMVVRYMPNSGHGGPPGTRVMTIFGSCVGSHFPNIQDFDVYGGLWSPGGISSFFSSNFPSNAIRIMSGDLFLTRVMTIFINMNILDIQGKEGREEGRKEGRKEARKRGRKEGREEGRQEGREEERKEGRKEGREERRREGRKGGLCTDDALYDPPKSA